MENLKHNFSKNTLSMIVSFLHIIVLTLGLFTKTTVFAGEKEDYLFLPKEVVVDKIRGGLLGQILGNLNGLPHEMKYVHEPGSVYNYVPSLTDGAWTDDDTDFEWVYIVQMQKQRNLFLSSREISGIWEERINNRIWCSNLYARHLMDIGIDPPLTGNGLLNPWANFNLSGQFLSETFALIAPVMPQTAARIGLNYTTVAIDNEPAQSTQFFTTIIAMAFVESDMDKLLDYGLSAVDQNSQLVEIVNDVRTWYAANPDSWRKTRNLLKEKYTLEDGNIRDTNGFELNTGSVIAALLYGNNDFAESLKVAFNFGWDADCNAATVGTILGVIYGYRNMMNHDDPFSPDWQIVDRYKNTTRENMPNNETITSFADRIVELFELANAINGGSSTLIDNIVVYKIFNEPPSPVRNLVNLNEQAEKLSAGMHAQIKMDLFSDQRKDRSRAAYMSVCFGLADTFAKEFPEQWAWACADLKGYWKIMNNIFSKRHNFSELRLIRDKFIKAGFTSPLRDYSNQEVWNDRATWKSFDEIYSSP